MMPAQHLSDEAVAAFADGVLTGHARGRAQRHCAECAECAEAVRGQREAVLVLRDAAAPPLPTGLLDKLRGLPTVTPITAPPTVVLPDGTAMLATGPTLGDLSALSPTPHQTPHAPQSRHRAGSWTVPLAVVALSAALATGAAAGSDTGERDGTEAPASAVTVDHTAPQPTGPLQTAVRLAAYTPEAGAR